MVEGAYIAQYKNSLALTNLRDFGVDDYKDDFGGFKWNQAISDDGTRMVALPWDLGPTLFYYRTDVFEEVGLPTAPEEVDELMSTWDGVLEVAEKVSIPGQRWFLPSAAYPYQWMFINRDYYDEDLNLRLERDGDLECLQACLDIRNNGWDMNVDMWSSEAYAAYANGSCVCVAAGSWFSGFLKTDIDPDGAGHWGATRLPGGLPEYIRMLGDYIGYVHMIDTNGELYGERAGGAGTSVHLPLGEGILDFDAILDALWPYAGQLPFWSLDFFACRDAEHTGIDSLRFLREKLAKYEN